MRRVTVHCDYRECDTFTSEALAEDAGFVVVEWHGELLDFCSADHLLHGMAGIAEPMWTP